MNIEHSSSYRHFVDHVNSLKLLNMVIMPPTYESLVEEYDRGTFDRDQFLRAIPNVLKIDNIPEVLSQIEKDLVSEGSRPLRRRLLDIVMQVGLSHPKYKAFLQTALPNLWTTGSVEAKADIVDTLIKYPGYASEEELMDEWYPYVPEIYQPLFIRQVKERKWGSYNNGENVLWYEPFSLSKQLHLPANPENPHHKLDRDFYRTQKQQLASFFVSIRAIITDNPDIDRESLSQLVNPFVEKNRFSADVVNRLYGYIDHYIYQHQRVENIRSTNPDLSHLCNDIFGFIPNGKVEVIYGPISVHLRFYAEEDFINAYLWDKDHSTENIQHANTVMGAAMSEVMTPTYSKLITLENMLHTQDPDDYSVFYHEQEHQFFHHFVEERISLLLPTVLNILTFEPMSPQRRKELLKTSCLQIMIFNSLLQGTYSELMAGVKDGTKSDANIERLQTGKSYQFIPDDPEKRTAMISSIKRTFDTVRMYMQEVVGDNSHPIPVLSTTEIEKDLRLIKAEYLHDLLTSFSEGLSSLEGKGYTTEEQLGYLYQWQPFDWAKNVRRIPRKT